MNTKGMKFLAVLAVLAMAFAVFAVVSDSQGNDAEISTVTGPLNFKGTYTAQTSMTDVEAGVTKATNAGLGNNILVAYDDATKTYTLTGTLAMQTAAYTTEWNAAADTPSKKVFYADYPSYATDGKKYGLVIAAVEGTFTITNAKGVPTAATDELLLYLESATLSKRTVVYNEKTYYVDLSGLTLASTTDKNPATPYVRHKCSCRL